MSLTIVILLNLSLTAYLLFIMIKHGYDYAFIKKVPVGNSQPINGPLVSVLIPVRNEKEKIGQCLRSLEEQTYSNLEVIVIDDHSTDGTLEFARSMAKSYGNIQVLEGQTLPQDWLGKNHALHYGSRFAKGDWLLFVDADVVLHPDCLSSTLAYALENKVDLFSMGENLKMESFWERAILPVLLEWFRSNISFRAITDKRSKEGRACGTYLLFRREAYQAIGGHEAVKWTVLEDSAFGKLIKENGFRLGLLDGKALISVRHYQGLPKIWNGWTKNSFGLVGSSPRGYLKAITYLVCTNLLPIGLGIMSIFYLRQPLTKILGCLPLVLVLIYKSVLNIGFGIHPLYTPLTILLGGITAVLIQLNVMWKIFIKGEIRIGGRIYPAKALL